MSTFGDDAIAEEGVGEQSEWSPYRQYSRWERFTYGVRRAVRFVVAQLSPSLIRTRERLRDELQKASDDLWPVQYAVEREGQSTLKLSPAFRRARLAYERGDVTAFWKHLYTIREWELRAIDELQHGQLGTVETNIEIPTLEEKALSVLGEARGYLAPARFERVEALLLADDQIRPDLTRDHVLAALQILYERYVRDYSAGFTLRALETQFLTFVTATLASIVVLLYGIPLFGYDWMAVWMQGDATPGSAFLVVVVWFGVLGASVSGLLSLSDVLKRGAVPEQQGYFSLALGRLVVGAAGALVLYVFLLSGVLGLVLNVSPETPGIAIVVAFAGGFSERLLRRAIENVAGREVDVPSTDRPVS